MTRAVVLLFALAGCSAPSAPSAPAHARDPAPAQRSLKAGEPVLRVRLRSLDEKFTRLVISRDGVQSVSLEPGTPGPLELAPYPSFFRIGEHAYLGGLEWRDGVLIHRVALENYLLGVLRGEIALGEVPLEAAAAQAIAARSYTLHHWRQNSPRYDLDDTTLFQHYVGLRYAKIDATLREAVARTRGRYLSFEGAPLKAYYHSTCGGHTTDVSTGLDRANILPMSGVPCEFCRASRHYSWKELIPDATIVKAAGLGGELTTFEVLERGPGGRARTVRVVAGGVTRDLKANAFRLAAGPQLMRSTRLLAVHSDGKAQLIEGAGWGHGVGLCQMGAMGMARSGRDSDAILAHYYPGARIDRAY